MLFNIAGWIVYRICRLAPDTLGAKALVFFINDSIKILLLLFVMIFVLGFLRTFLDQHQIRQWLNRRGIVGYVMAAAFGAITPFCSCSSIPLFFTFLKAGVPLGVVFAFLITSPVINEYLVVLMLGAFGWKITALYVVSGLVIGIASGLILGRMRLEGLLVRDMQPLQEITMSVKTSLSLKERLSIGWREAVSVLSKLWAWILLGVAIGAIIHGYVPNEMIQGLLNKAGVWSVPLATIIGVPLYGNCASIVPVAVVLFEKGIPLGTALSFMMAVSALSLPEAIMLKRAMRTTLIAIFFGITTIAIILTGYLFNFLQPILVS